MLETLLRQLQQAQTQQGGCAYCALEHYQVSRYLMGVANDGVNNIPLRQRLQQQGGYCLRHCQAFNVHSHVLSSAILLDAFVSSRLARVEAGKRPQVIACEACSIEDSTRKLIRDTLGRYRNDSQVQQLLQDFPPCLPHLESFAPKLPAPLRQTLVAQHQPLRHNLAELIRKHDYRFQQESISDAERGSIQAALRVLGAAESSAKDPEAEKG